MRDAVGGVVNITIIVVFLVIVSGYLAFNVNYTKAFRVKNKIISTIEQYEGNCTMQGGACDKAITEYMKEIGYSATNFTITSNDNDGVYQCRNGYCIKEIKVDNPDDANNNGFVNEGNITKAYYNVVTVINIDIPILNKIMPNLKLFQVSGNTRVINTTGGK